MTSEEISTCQICGNQKGELHKCEICGRNICWNCLRVSELSIGSVKF
jgi:methionyl-tRNA synthetase